MQVVIVVSISCLIITDEVGTVDNVTPIPMDKDEEVAARFFRRAAQNSKEENRRKVIEFLDRAPDAPPMPGDELDA